MFVLDSLGLGPIAATNVKFLLTRFLSSSFRNWKINVRWILLNLFFFFLKELLNLFFIVSDLLKLIFYFLFFIFYIL